MDEPKPVLIDANGDKWWNFLFSYDWEGKEYAFDICARSEQEARERLKRLPLARYDGQGDGKPAERMPGNGRGLDAGTERAEDHLTSLLQFTGHAAI